MPLSARSSQTSLFLCLSLFFDIPFVKDLPEFRCKFRDGRYCEFLSYGYKEVQDFIIDSILQAAKHGFDGIMLIMIRGHQLLFEEPVQKLFAKKFGDEIDCRRLPSDDPRLIEVRSDIMTEFHHRLRAALNEYAKKSNSEPLKIYVSAYFDIESSKNDGLDVERFAKEGLIDGVIQSKMKVWEEVDDLLAEDGLIDLKKYEEKANSKFIYRRFYLNEPNMIAEGIPAYRAIADKYNIDFYSEIQWENSVGAEDFVKAEKKIYESGGKGISLWDCYPLRTIRPAEWNAVSHLGDHEVVAAMSEDETAYHTIHKVLSFGGRDMRYMHPCWRG